MASSENPQTSPLTKEAPAETSSVVLPPLPQPQVGDASGFLRRRSRLDALLVAVVLVFAFLVASVPVTNSDFFRQAAIGRLLTQGKYHFGVDPFVYTADDGYFVNHSWLFDVLVYGLYQFPAGGAVVVIFKTLLITALAVVLLAAGRRAGQSLWIPAICTAVAVLVASPRLMLQSTCLSYLFLGLTLWLLTSADKGRKRWWLLPPLFALWVNCDSWFFLGPLTVALYLAGELLEEKIRQTIQPIAPAPGLPSLKLGEGKLGAACWLVLAVGIAACFLNPHHVRAWTLPPELGLSPAGDLLAEDGQFLSFFVSPLGKNYYKPYFGLSVSGLAYWPLMLLGLASFVVTYNRVVWPRLLVWMAFALMSLYNWRAIPFFAIVAGPITALNWLDFAAQRFGIEPRLTGGWRGLALGGRSFTLLLGVVLLIATVPGWLQRSYPTFHPIGWSVQIDPSFKEMADAIHGWREAGLLPEEPHWFNMNYGIANYLAWFAPGERVFLDQSLTSFRTAAEEYMTVRKGLEPVREQGSSVTPADWQQILRDRDVRFWIYDYISGRTSDIIAFGTLLSRSDEWTLCHLKGRIAIFAKRDARAPASDPSNRLALDIERSAFGPRAETAPPHGAEPTPLGNWWHTVWDVWWRREPPPSSDRETLQLFDFRHQIVDEPRQVYLYSRAWQGAVAAASIAGSMPPAPLPNNLLPLAWSYTYNDLFPPGVGQMARSMRKSEQPALQARENYLNNQFIEPPSLYLAVRAARRALLVDPEDGPTYLRLGQAYQRLRNLRQESQLRRLPPQLAPQINTIRRTQMIAAFHNSLNYPLDDEKIAEVHGALSILYARELGYIDAAVHHFRLAYEKRSALGPPLGVTPTDYQQMLDQMNTELSKMDAELGRRMDRYDVNTASKSGMEKVTAALQEGLSETALTVLEQEGGVNVEKPLDVLLVKALTGVALDLGRLDKARMLLPDQQGQHVKLDDLDLYLRMAAARGDYAEVDRLLDDALRHAWETPPGVMRMPEAGTQVAPLLGQVLLAEARHAMGSPCAPWVPKDLTDIFRKPLLAQNSSSFWRRRWLLQAIVNGLLATRQRAEWYFTRGWLALEAGHCEEARKYLENARDLAVPFKNWAPAVSKLGAWMDEQAEPREMQQVGFRHAILYEQSAHYLNWLKD